MFPERVCFIAFLHFLNLALIHSSSPLSVSVSLQLWYTWPIYCPHLDDALADPLLEKCSTSPPEEGFLKIDQAAVPIRAVECISPPAARRRPGSVCTQGPVSQERLCK